RLRASVQPKVGQGYRLLHERERRAVVARRDQRVGPRLRRLFRLTTRGERALRTWLTRRPAWPPPLRDEIFIRLLAVERDGPKALLDQLARQEMAYRRYVDLVQTESARPEASLTRRLAQEAALGQVEAHLRWLAHCRAALGPHATSLEA